VGSAVDAVCVAGATVVDATQQLLTMTGELTTV
jgi:hypothetical protein